MSLSSNVEELLTLVRDPLAVVAGYPLGLLLYDPSGEKSTY